jgi:hypothetical protein
MKPEHNVTPDTETASCGCQKVSDSHPENTGASAKRRRLLRAGLSAGPVVLALSGKSAMATSGQICRFPSTWASIDPTQGGNAAGLSHHPSTGDENCGFGRSPGYWKQPQKRGFWPGLQGAGPIPDKLPCSLGTTPTGVSSCSDYLGDGTKVSSIFGTGGNSTFSQMLCSTNGQDIYHYLAAYLNAWTVQGYPLTPPQVVAMWYGSFKVGSVTWTREQGRSFIESTYHGNGSDPAWKPGISQQNLDCKETSKKK